MRSGLMALVAMMVSAPAMAADVSVTITGVKAKGGTIRLALYDERNFMRAAPFNIEAKGDRAGDVTVTFHDVPAGDYAVAAFHDADDNHAMSMVDGRLKEGTALSNAAALRGPPSFAVNKIAIPAAGARLSLEMSYPEDRQGW